MNRIKSCTFHKNLIKAAGTQRPFTLLHDDLMTAFPSRHDGSSPVGGSSRPLFQHLLRALLLPAVVQMAGAASILWVSDAPPNLGFSGPLTGMTDQGFVRLLQNAGHTVERYDNPEAATTLLTPAEIDKINSYDLVIIGRATGSGQFTTGQGDQWNTNIVKPLIIMSSYLVRTDGGRPSWFVGGNGVLPDNAAPTPVTAVNAADPAVDYLLGGVFMSGLTTARPFDELMDRNTSFITNPVETGGRVLLNAAIVREDNGQNATVQVVADLPAGLPVKAGAQTLAGYRMFFAGGSRESATAPHNNIPLYTGRENLSPTGEDIFLRAVELALNRGVPPATDPNAPMAITAHPANASVSEGATVTFSVSTTGAAGRTLQWQRDDGSGFLDIPGASTPFLKSTLVVSNVTVADHNARFRVVATNPNNSVSSDPAILTVNEDTAPPVPLSAGSVDGKNILICFNERLDTRGDDQGGTVTDEFNYVANGANPATAIAQPDGKSVLLTFDTPVTGAFTVGVSLVEDVKGNAMSDVPTEVHGSVLGLTSTAVGSVNPAGSVIACSPTVFDVTAGGMDLGLTATAFTDTFQFAHRSIEGDFDARVRVLSLVGPLRLESTAKAILTARPTTEAGSPAFNVFVTPPAPGDDTVTASIRSAAGVNTNHLGTVRPGGLPGNAWMRIVRTGNNFTAYNSADGNAWNLLGATAANFPSSLVVGVGAASHRNGMVVVATFSNLQITPLTRLVAPALNGTTFTASFGTTAGVAYKVQYKNSLSDTEWQLLETIAGDGTLKTFTDTGATGANRYYRIDAQ